MLLETAEMGVTKTQDTMPEMMKIGMGGLAIADMSGTQAIARVEVSLEHGRQMKLGFVNAHCVNIARRNATYRDALAGFLLLPDGVGVDIGAKILHGQRFSENLNGTDFIPRLVAALSGHRRIALVGAAPGVAERAAASLAAVAPNHDYVAIADGYFDDKGRRDILDRLVAERADIVLVALGVPAQEIFINRYLAERHGTVFIAVGALFDFLAGNVARAPRPIRKLRLEWIWRLALEPRRLFRRYLVGNPVFLKEIAVEKLGRWRRKP